jgi:hypothetical protein
MTSTRKPTVCRQGRARRAVAIANRKSMMWRARFGALGSATSRDRRPAQPGLFSQRGVGRTRR